MARRVKQADGRYCYTENCRIHDRSGDSTGVQAIINDAKLHQYSNFIDSTSANLQEQLGVDPEVAAKMSQKVVEAALNTDKVIPAYDIAEAIKEAAQEEGLDPAKLEVIPAAYEINTAMINQAAIRKGDEVILNETGERGVIAEGNSAFGGAVRFNPESIRSRNSFAWFQPKDMTKVECNSDSLMREKLLSNNRSSLFPAHSIRLLLEEESSPTTRNAQGTKEFGKHAKEARAHMQAIGAKIEKDYAGLRLTKEDVIETLQRHYDTDMAADVPVEVVKATKSGLRNIISYLDPTGDHR